MLKFGARHVTLQQARQASVFAQTPRHRQVLNQVDELSDFNAFYADPRMRDGLQHYGANWAEDDVKVVGQVAGSDYMKKLAHKANTQPPVLQTHDTRGRRIDKVEFDDSYHEVMRLGFTLAVPSYGWIHGDKAASQVARSCMSAMMYSAEAGTSCPQTMTFACVPVLEKHATQHQLDSGWLEKAVTADYDPRNVPIGEKSAISLGMSMTEAQGGSDVRANTTFAEPLNEAEGQYLLYGHKWFTSAPMSDGFLTLAKTGNDLSCFLVPRWVPHTNEWNQGLQFRRLKNKLGDRSNASSEVEYHGAYAELLGPVNKGISTIIDMVQHTRLDCMVGSAGLMRRCYTEALHHVTHRRAFGTALIDTPLMAAVMADLALEAEASMALALKVARTFNSDGNKAFGRIATAIGKYHTCKRATNFVYECLEALGGNGYIEDGLMPRLFRQAPLNAIWEGSGNVICLDILRSLRQPEVVQALIDDIQSAPGACHDYKEQSQRLIAMMGRLDTDVGAAREFAGQAAMLLQACALYEQGTPELARYFVLGRLSAGFSQREYGTAPISVEANSVILKRQLSALESSFHVNDCVGSAFQPQ
eukprot:TRINITY_DN11964_c0_g6_i2.p1 TRINITY_DN11964_c0_g6~~TRINITY_DN11964_c0_g6_i2.p1  ORF type:complete len:588 (+),score=109.08 TRINITY_DN11964_c0_g6_i2:144-1907(+)